MDLNFVYTNNNSPDFASLFSSAYQKIRERREDSKSSSKTSKPSGSQDTPSPKTSPEPERWNPTRRSRPTRDSHAEQTKSAAEAVQTYTGKATRATEARPKPRVNSSQEPRQFDPTRRRALPYQQEDPVGAREAPKVGKHGKDPDALGRHAAGPPPAYETRPMRPRAMGRHAR